MQIIMECNDIFKSFEPLWEIGGLLFKENNKIGFNIKFFCLNQLIQHKDKYTKEQTNTLIGMVQEVQEIQKKINPSDIHCKQKEYESFIMNYFSHLESQRTNGVFTLELGHKYKMFSYLLEPLEQFNSLNEKARKIQTFCVSTSKEMLEKCSIGKTNINGSTSNSNIENNCNNKNNSNTDSAINNKEETFCSKVNDDNNTNQNQNRNFNEEENHLFPQEPEGTNAITSIDANINSINPYTNNHSKNKEYLNDPRSIIKENNQPFGKQIGSKRKYVNINTPSGENRSDNKTRDKEALISCTSSRNKSSDFSDSFPEKIDSYKRLKSNKELYVNKQEFKEILTPPQFTKQAEFAKKNNFNAINEFKTGNIIITIQLIKNSINTLHTFPKKRTSVLE